MASVDNGITITLDSNTRSPANGQQGTVTINDSTAYCNGNLVVPTTAIDDGETTFVFESNNRTSANGQATTSLINSSIRHMFNTFKAVANETEVGNTILFPASAYDALVEPSIRFYKIRGYYAAGSTFETWVSQYADSSPPSGHTLQNISVVDTWTV